MLSRPKPTIDTGDEFLMGLMIGRHLVALPVFLMEPKPPTL